MKSVALSLVREIFFVENNLVTFDYHLPTIFRHLAKFCEIYLFWYLFLPLRMCSLNKVLETSI